MTFLSHVFHTVYKRSQGGKKGSLQRELNAVSYETDDGAASNILAEWVGAHRVCFGRLSKKAAAVKTGHIGNYIKNSIASKDSRKKESYGGY